MTQPSKDLLAHGRRVALIEWHPTARDLLLSSAYDYKVQTHTHVHPLTCTNNLVWPLKVSVFNYRNTTDNHYYTLYTSLFSNVHAVNVWQVFVWCLDTDVGVIRTPVRVINTHQHLVLSLTFNRDGSLIATTCKDQKIRIIEPQTGRVLQVTTQLVCVCVCVFSKIV